MSGTKFVLVVEDDDEIRSLIVSSLKAEVQESGQNSRLIVVEARDGREALQYTGRQEFHCLVTDLNMPHTSGQELIKSLLSDTMNANTPTVVVSAGVDADFLAAFRGVRSIPKPFDPVALSQIVLREIKLGRMDERVPVHLLSPFAESMRSILLQDMHLGPSDVSVLPPALRRSGQRMEGDIYTSVNLTTGMMQARIGLSFDRHFLLQMKDVYFASRRAQLAGTSDELIARHTMQVLIEKSHEALLSIFGSAPRVAEISVIDLSDEPKSNELAKAPGVSIALTTDQGRVFISALAPSKAKRGQA